MENEIDELFLCVLESLEKYSFKQFTALKIDKWKDAFFHIELDKRAYLLKALIAIGGGKANVADLTPVGGTKFAGKLVPNYSKLLTSDKGITFIDQSITGMFERRTHIGL